LTYERRDSPNPARGTLAQARAQWQAALANSSGATSAEAAAFANADADMQNARIVQAATTSADATVTKSRALLELARQTLLRDRALLVPGFIAQNQYDTDYSNQVAADTALSSAVVAARQARVQLSSARSTATAGTAAGSASASQATGFARTAAADLAAIDAATALVTTATINLKNTVISSPVDGTVIARNVSIGQTVAASFQTPTLYTIAEDLAQMEIDLAAGEPDIGTIHVGQHADFTVLAYPDHTFHATVAQVRFNPTTVQNVVTYDTVLYENNSDRLLRPGMTVDASIETARSANALVVSLTALNFRAAPPAPGSASSAAPPSPWGDTGASRTVTPTSGSRATVTVVEGERCAPFPSASS
jgi:HlyD family secretion protein